MSPPAVMCLDAQGVVLLATGRAECLVPDGRPGGGGQAEGGRVPARHRHPVEETRRVVDVREVGRRRRDRRNPLHLAAWTRQESHGSGGRQSAGHSGVAHIDEPGRWLYFLAGGREAGHDPYYSHLYRVRFDGSELTLLTPGNAHHEVKFSPDGRFFVDTYSTVADAPVHVLRSDAGATLLELGRADTSRLTEQGWTPPQRFSAKAADGKTDIYGVLFLPRDFDEKQSYPLIDATYGANFRIQTPRSFLQDRQNAIALAQLGFVVMMVDGRGTPLRSQSMQDLGFGRWDVNLDDHVAAIRQLAERHRFIDADRVGVYGHSAGGFSTVHAMLEKPELFKVGFASAGSHDFDLFIHPSTNHQNFYRSGFTNRKL